MIMAGLCLSVFMAHVAYRGCEAWDHDDTVRPERSPILCCVLLLTPTQVACAASFSHFETCTLGKTPGSCKVCCGGGAVLHAAAALLCWVRCQDASHRVWWLH